MKRVAVGGLVVLALVSACSSNSYSAATGVATKAGTAPPTTRPGSPSSPTTAQRAKPTPGKSPVGTVGRDSGFLQSFAPESMTSWWAIVESNLTSRAYVARTTDSGQSWGDVLTPSGEGVAAYDFLNAETAWIAVGGPGSADPPLYRTTDGGRGWQRMGTDPGACELEFVDQVHGWCIDIGAAAGSESTEVYRTSDGGQAWTLVSRNLPGIGVSPTPGALPFGCDKTIAFTDAHTGYAPFYCNGGSPYLYKSADAGTHWWALGPVPPPPGAPTGEGQGFDTPVVDGQSLAMVYQLGRVAAVATSSDGGTTWKSQLLPRPLDNWIVDLIDPSHWRLTNGTEVMATDDAGAHWRTSTPAVPLISSPYGEPDNLDFLTPLEGWAVPGDGGPVCWTDDGGTTWMPLQIIAGPYKLPG